jgi:hypothetical protein
MKIGAVGEAQERVVARYDACVIVVMVLVFAGILGLAMLVSDGFEQRNRRRLQQLSARLDGEPDTKSSFLIARGGQRVKFWRARRPVGKTSVPWTEIDVEIPRVYPLAMYVRRQRRSDAGPIERGETIDVEVGDGVFDAAFLVEAAPEVVIVKLLDQDARTFLLAQGTVELMTKERGGVRVLQLAIRGWIDDPDAAKHAIAIVVGIASRIRDAFTEAVEQVPMIACSAWSRPRIAARSMPSKRSTRAGSRTNA